MSTGIGRHCIDLMQLAYGFQRNITRPRILHDVVPVRHRKEAFRLVAERQRRMVTRKIVPRVIIATYHPKPGYQHLHLVHDCTWAARNCRCTIMQSLQFRRCTKPPVWSADFHFNAIFRLTEYLFQQGREMVYLQIGSDYWLSSSRYTSSSLCRCPPIPSDPAVEGVYEEDYHNAQNTTCLIF